MATRRTVLLPRHAQTEDSRPGVHDHDRRLTAEREAQAQAVGAAFELEAASLVEVRLP